MGRAVTVATCALNQWALDFEGNLERIIRSEWGGGTSLLPSFPSSLRGFLARPWRVQAARFAGRERAGRARAVFDPTLFQVSTSQRAAEPGTGLVQSSKSGKSAQWVLGAVWSRLITGERSVGTSAT